MQYVAEYHSEMSLSTTAVCHRVQWQYVTEYNGGILLITNKKADQYVLKYDNFNDYVEIIWAGVKASPSPTNNLFFEILNSI